MKKVVAIILVVLMLASFASCGGKSNGKEDLYIGKAQSLIDAGDYEGAIEVLNSALKVMPDSETLKGMLESAQETIEFDKVPTEEQVLERYNEMMAFANKWFVDRNFSQAVDPTDVIINVSVDGSTDPYPAKGYLVTESGYSTLDDLHNLFYKYCNEEMFEDLMYSGGFINFIDYEGKLYIVYGEGGWYGPIEKKDQKVTKISDDDFELTYLEIEDETYYYDCSIHYVKGENGYQFTGINRVESPAYAAIELGDYVINTEKDPLIMHDVPKSGTENIGTIPKGTKVTVTESVYGWAYVTYNSKGGWVSSDYLAPYTGESSDSANTYTAGDAVGDLVDAGVNIAGGIINSIF